MHAAFLYNKLYHIIRLPVILTVLLCCLLFCAGKSVAQDVHEDQIKSVFLYNLVHFVTWPQSVVSNAPTFNIEVCGNASFIDILEQTVETETKESRPLLVSQLSDLGDITPLSRIIFITKDASADWDKIHEKIAGLPILTVSDQKDFTRRGGMVGLLRQDKKIEIEVNYVRVQQAGLSMSAKLLRLARIVE